jgi:hypothetical protein
LMSANGDGVAEDRRGRHLQRAYRWRSERGFGARGRGLCHKVSRIRQPAAGCTNVKCASSAPLKSVP